jgi:hypothetical protein
LNDIDVVVVVGRNVQDGSFTLLVYTTGSTIIHLLLSFFLSFSRLWPNRLRGTNYALFEQGCLVVFIVRLLGAHLLLFSTVK